MTETSTSSRVALEVPSPWTLLTVGERYDSSAVNYDGVNYSGVCVNTDEHVRMYAKGDASESDLIGQATGRVWLQANQNLVAVAQKSLIVGSYKDTYLAAADGILVMAGFATANATSESSPGSFPNAASNYESKANIASTVWSVFNIAMGILGGVSAVAQAITTGKFMWIGAAKAAVNIVGTGLNIAGLGFSKDVPLPGLNLFSEGGNFYTALYGSVNIHGLAGLLVGGLFHYEIAATTAKVRGFKRASLAAVSHVDMCAGLWYEAKTDGAHTYAARTGPIQIRGVKMKLGQAKTKPPQAPTVNQTFSSLAETKWSCMKTIKMMALTKVGSSALANTTIDAVDSVSFQVGPPVGPAVFEVVVKNASVEVAAPTAGTKLKAAPNGLTITGPGGVSYITCKPTGIEVKAGAGTLTVAPAGAITVDGLELKIG